MNALSASIRHNLARLTDFSGRETRVLFWPYVLLLFGAVMVAGFLVVAPIMLEMMAEIQRLLIEQGQNPPQGDAGTDGQSLPPGLMPDFAGLVLPMAVINLLFVLLIAASVARRLHDGDRTGLWGLLPLPFTAFGTALTPRALDVAAAPDNMTLFFLLGLNNFIYWGALIALVIMLALEGTKGPNRYGPEPPHAP